jgi:uncharacterized protein with FMN-binding domain
MVAVILIVAAGCASESALREYSDSIVITDPDLSTTEDGTYRGDYRIEPPFGIWVANPHVEVDVQVANHRYEKIDILTESVRSMEEVTTLGALVIEHQSLQVDGLTAATSLTGKTFLKAIESALD